MLVVAASVLNNAWLLHSAPAYYDYYDYDYYYFYFYFYYIIRGFAAVTGCNGTQL
jgi:hypothetical protein